MQYRKIIFFKKNCQGETVDRGEEEVVPSGPSTRRSTRSMGVPLEAMKDDPEEKAAKKKKRSS